MNRIPKRIWCSCQKYVFFSHLGYREVSLLFVNSAESAHHTPMTSTVRTSRKFVRSPVQNCFSLFFGRSRNGKYKAMVAHNCHGKTKNLTAKTKTSRENQKPHGKNKIPQGKTKNLTAKTKYLTAKPKPSRQNQILHSKNKIALVLP